MGELLKTQKISLKFHPEKLQTASITATSTSPLTILTLNSQELIFKFFYNLITFPDKRLDFLK